MPSAAPGLVEIGIGDLFVSATVDLGEVLGPPFGGSIEFEMYVSALVEGSFAADAERQKLVFEPAAAHGAIEVVALDDPRLAGALRAVLEPAVGGFMAGLVEVLVGSIPLPSFPLSDLVASQQGRVLALASPTVDRPLDDSTRVTGAIVNRPDCGDGLVLAGEACDDANRAPGDGCDDACRVEPGFACAGQPSACAPLCGNGALDPGEGCDDGARLDGDGCDAACTVEPGFVCAGEPSQCRGTGTPITGTRLGIVNRVPDDEKKNRLAFVARDPAIPLAVPGSADDPRCSAPGGGGGALAVASPTSGQSFAQDLPCDNWELLGTETEPRGYQYSDKELDDGPCRRVTIIGGKRVEAICVGRGPGYLGYDLEEGRAEPPVRVRLTVGEQLLCAAFPGATKDGSDGRKLVSIDAPPPASCP
jgi:cysteine-rich repeat protein